MIDNPPSYSIRWEAHPNIERNREYGIGSGRMLTDNNIQLELMEILTDWVK